MSVLLKRSIVVVLASVALVCGADARLRAQDRSLGKEDIILLGLGLRVEPDHQTVPRDVATIVSTFLATSTPSPGEVPPFAPGAIVRATLRGPGVGAGLALTASPNSPFNIPPLSTAGIYTLDDIRLESGGELLMRGVPESVTIEVIEKLLVTQVTARALSAQEIREKGIVFDKSNFQAYNFTAAFAVQDTPIHISFPVLLPTLQGARDITLDSFSGGGAIPEPTLPQLKTIIPDTLRLQTQLPNLQVVGFSLLVKDVKGQSLAVPPIPGIVVIPGDIGFLNQVFSVLLLVGNVAPPGSNLVVDNLTGEIHLPAGNDTVVGSSDDPLRLAMTANGPAPGLKVIAQPGPDGIPGSADDLLSLAAGQNGSAEFLVEGRREGTWVVEFGISGTLLGLPVGPVQVTGRAAGSVLVRNPSFTLTFTHPEVVMAREPYTLDVTVTNTSASPANFVSVNLHERHVTGATVSGEPTREIESIPAGESATVSFDLVSRVTGRVTAATLDADDPVQGRFALKTSVGELGVPVSPDSLVLPREASALPTTVRNEALSLVGKAWAVATAPTAALPRDVPRLSKQIVLDRAVQIAEAGFRISLHEPPADSAVQLAMDFIGSDFTRLASLSPGAGDLEFARQDFTAFDDLRRRSVRGDTFASAVGKLLAPDLASRGAAAFHRQLAEKVAYRPAHLSVLAVGNGPLPYTISLVDAQGRRIGRADDKGKVIKQIPFGDLVPVVDQAGALMAQLIMLTAPEAGEYHVQFDRVPGVTAVDPVTVSLVVPSDSGGQRQIVYSALTANSIATSSFTPGDSYRVVLDLPAPGSAAQSQVSPDIVAAIVPPAPHVIGVVQQADKDLTLCAAIPLGRVLAVLFSSEVTPASVQDRLAASAITNYALPNNRIVGVALQPGRRIAFLGLRDGVGPFVPRDLTISAVMDSAGHTLPAETVPVEMTVDYDAAVVSGRVLEADGMPVPFASVRFLLRDSGATCDQVVGVSAKSTDDKGAFSWDWLPKGSLAADFGAPSLADEVTQDRIAAFNPATEDGRGLNFTIQRRGIRLDANIVFLGRGTLRGRTLAEDGTPLVNTVVRVTSLTDQSSYGMNTNAQGEFVFTRVPVGNVLIEAVNVLARSKGTASELIPLAGGTTVRDVRLFDLSSPAIVVKYGAVTGHVLKGDGASAAADVPVMAYYLSGSQLGVLCPGSQTECAVGAAHTDSAGRFQFDQISAGQIRLATFDQTTLQQGEARVTLPGNGTVDARILLAQGLGTVNGSVINTAGEPVAGARVGGGLSLGVTDASGHFTLTDVPVGRRDIRAVDDQNGTQAEASVDVLQAGQIVNVTIVLPSTGSIAGTVFQSNGSTPVPNQKVYLFFYGSESEPGVPGLQIQATAVTDASGRYTMARIPLRDGYTVSAFRPDFTDGNLTPVVLKFNHQAFRGDIVFRGGGGHVTGRVLDANGTTPLRAAVGISGDRVRVAGGLFVVGFQHVVNYQVANTDLATGAFAFDGVFTGPFTITAAGQFSPDPIGVESAMPSAGATIQLDVRLLGTSSIAGTVYQPDGVTPAGPDVIVRYRSSAFRVVCAGDHPIVLGNITIGANECDDVPQGIQDETVITDAAGRYLVPLVTGGPFTLTAEDPASGRTAQTLGAIKPGQSGDFSIRLLGVSTLTIRVRGSDTVTPIPGARVEVTQVSFPKQAFVGVADASGVLIVSGGDAFTEGDFTVKATDLRNGFAGRASGRVTGDGDVATTVFLYNASGTVFGTVFKADGLTRVPNAEVVISNPGGSLAFAVTDGAGDYRQDFIPLGSFRIDVFEAATARRGFAVGRVDLDRQDVPVDVTEAARGLVTGTAFAEGTLAPLKNWQVGLDQAAPGGGRSLPTLQTTTDIDGTFSLPGVTVGDFRVTVFKPWSGGNAPSGQATATSRLDTDGQRVDLPIVVGVQQRRYGRVEGTVFNPDGTPAADIAVDVCAIAACSFGTSGALHAQTAGDGTFAFDHVVTGRFVLTAKSQLSANGASVEGDLLFEGDVARLTLSLVGVSQISGTVVFSDGSPAGHVQLVLTGQPSSGCDRWCTGFADDFGAFTFINVPAHTFWVSVTDPVSGLNGGIGGTLTAGEHKDVRIVLQATSVVSGRILTAGGAPAARITVELIGVGVFPPPHLFQVTDENGLFRFPAVLNGSYAMTVQDPLGPGLAQRTLVAAGVVALGDIVLDEAPPSVASISPQASTIGIPLNAIVRLEFSEPVNLASLTPATVSLTGPSGPILATRQVSGDDNVVVLTPLAPLVQNTRYSVTVRGLTDRIGKTMASPFTASFTTIDLTPPEVIDLTPGQGGSGIALTSVIRIKYSEPVDPSKVVGPPVVLSAAGTAIQGITAFILGNTTLVFTPLAQLDENSEYRVRVAPAVDLAGNAQPQALSYVFRTLDRTPPQVVALTPAGDSTVTENGVTNVSADVGTSHDIAVVDFSINDQPNASARTSPFRLSFQAIAALGKPGDRIKISALATDTSGNRGVTPAVAFVTIVADRPPTVTVTSPAPGTEFRTGDRVSVTVHVTDDLGVTQVAYRGQTGHPQDAGTQAVAPSSLDVTRTFAFSIGADAVPGEPIVIGASATDSKGQVATASPVTITVLDATPPVISITGTTTGARVSPGQQTSAIVSAQDLGGVSSISFTTGGVLVGTQTRPVAPARSAVVTSFAFTVPASAHAGDILTLDATATDASGNVADAGRVLLPIADLNGPSLQLRTSNGSPVIAPGSLVNIVAQANDETGVASIALVGQGAFSVAQARQVTPISNSPELVFQIQVPAGAIEGAVLNVSAAATDIFGNVGAPATLTLTVQSLTNVVLPPSVLIAAGETLAVDVQLTAPSPSAGLQVALSSSDPAVAQVESLVQFAAGESTKSATLTGVRGGNASITASINAVQRATMTVTVRGGVVSGVVLDPQLQPVAGAQVTVTGGNVGDQTVTDEHGVYAVEGVTGNFQGGFTAFTVKVLDPSSGRIGFASGFLSAVGGFAHVNVVLVSAGSISGTVTKADGLTAVSAGARVDLFAAGDIYRTVLGTTLTDAGGAFDFPIVSPGRYLMEASDGAGNRGRSAAVTLATTGQHVTVAVAYLGRGALAVTVRDGAGHAVANTPLTLAVNSLFGQAPLVTANAAPDGTYRFDDVFVGTFTVQARDPLSNTAATASGSVGRDGEVVPVDLRLAQWGSLTGTVFRTDGTTPVAGARVSLFGGPYVTTTTDNDGHYAFTLVPLGGYWVEAREPATHGIGRSIGALTTHGLTVTQNVTFLPQGTMVVTVVDGGGSTVGGASVTVSSSDDVGGDTVEATAGADGVALVEHVLASSHVTVGAHANGLVGYVFTTLQPGELKTLTVALASTGSIVGTVFLPDGQTPATTASVALCDGCAKTPVGPDGAFRFDVQVQYRWTLVAYDGQGRKRAISSPITITQHGQLVTANMTLIGIGSVTGRVLNPDNSSAPNLLVTVRSLHPDFGSFTFAQTDAGGFYEVPVIVAGPVSATTGDAGRGLLGEAFGTLARDGDTLNLDILLKNNAVTFPATAYDGNAFPFDVQKNGAVGHGYNGVFAACCNSPATGASRLEVVVNGSATPFIGADIGTTEDGGREIVASQLGVAGLNVTRKVFVSPTYFARYLELITNPTLDALTVDLRVQHLVHNGVQLVTTSSGDAALDVSNADDPDRWLTVDAGADLDPFRFQSGVNPQVGFGWDGAGAARRVSAAAFTPNSNGSVVYEWSQVTIRPGETVAFMHFAVQQYSAAAARASLARLVELPPEALSGLSQTEIGAIQNFAVPANGTSTMAPLPPLGGTITGTVFEADGLLPVSSVNIYGLPDTLVRMNSSVVYFGRTYPAYATATGTFSFGANITVPLAPFTLDSVHPRTHVVSPPAAGGFEPGSSLTSADVVFSNTGIVRGVVRRSSGAIVPGAAITTGVSPYNVTHPPSGTDGRYLATGLAPEVTLLTAALTHPQGVSFTLKATASVTPAAGRSTVVDLTVPPTGFVMGTVTTAFGAVSTNTAVRLYGIDPANSFAFLQAVTDSGGVYRFTDVPPGTFTVRVTDPLTSVLTNVPAVVVADQTTTVDVSTLAIATLDLTVVYTNGQPAVNAFVEIQKSSVDQYFRTAGVTGADGHLLITNVPGGAFVLRAHRPGAFSSATIDVPGTVTTHGAVIPITAVVPPLGTVLVRVTSPAGDPVAGARIDDVTGFAQSRGTTDANGELLLTNVIGGKAFKLRAYQPPSFSDYRETVGQLTGEGQVLTLPIVLGTTGSVGGHVTFVGGAPAGSVTVQVFTDVPRRNFVATTDASGAFQITGVALGAFRVTGRSIGNNSAGSFLGRIDTHGQTVTVDMTLADVILPATLRDANGHDYRVIADGRLTGSLGSTDGYESAFRLTFGPSGTIDNGFGGDNLASLELSARQLVIRDFEQGGAATPRVTGGIALTRKVFVPESGYFARYLEIFENTTTAPVTIDVQLRNELNSTRLVSTSSGDSVFTTADQWLVADAPAFPNAPAVAHVFEGSGATVGVGEVQPNASFLVQPVERWNTVVVPAGGRAILMHFTAQESNAAGAQAAAERLVQLPPEAVAGLTPPERQAIVNFVVPADGSSAVAPLVTVTGIVRVADGLPPVAGALVTVTGSRAPLFKPAIVVSTDAEGRYRASTLGVGPFTVQARDPISGALTPVASGVIGAGDVTVTQDLSFSTVGTLTGTVRFPDGSLATGDVHGTWVSSGVVSVSGGSPALSLQVPIAANGTFTVAAIPTGTYTLQWMAQSTVPFVQPRVATVPGVVVSSGQTTIAEIRLMAVATVRLTARRSDGSPLFNTWANIRRNDGLGFQGAGRTDSEEGVLFINNVPEGPFTIQMLGNDFVSVIGAVDGVVAPADDSQVVNVLFELLVRSVHGRVFARDGSTPVPNAYVELHGQADNSWIGWASTGADGSYRFEDVTVPSGGDSFRVIAYSPNFDVTVEGLGTFGAVTPAIDLTLPIAIVRGTVRYADGAPASQATVSIAQEDTSGNVQGAGVSTGSDGAFTTTANSGPFELWVRDERGTLQTLVGGDVPPASALETVDVVLPPSGRVSGSVRKADDQAIQSPSVAVSSSDAGSAVQWTDVSPFTFLRVPQGRFSLQGCDRDPVTDAGGVSSPQFVCGTANGAIAGDGAIATVDFTVAGTGSVTVTAVDADGVTPMPDVLVQIFAGTDGPLGVNAPYGPTDAAGVYSVAHVPEGLVTAVLYEPDTYRPLGFQWGTLTAPGVLNLTIARGTAMECATSLTGTNGLTWYVGCSGELVQGGDGLDPSPYQRASGIRINGVANTSAVALRLEPNARQVIAGPFQIAGVRVERKVFVPASGSFVRHLDTITNPSASPVTVDVDIEDILGGAVRVLTEPAATGNTYAVTLADPVLSPSSVYTRPALGLVFAGPEASVVAGPIRLPYLFGQASYRWTVTIPAGGSVTLMHFVVQRDAMTPMAADAQARALANLTDSSALAEMTSAEKARVVNFKIP